MADNLSEDIINEARTKALDVWGRFGTIHEYYQKYREMYFMDGWEKPKNSYVDKHDWAITPSPSARNEIQGMKRLLDTSEINVQVMEGEQTSQNSDKIERAMRRVVDVSGEGRKNRLLSDASLAAPMYGPVILMADMYADLLLVKGLTNAKKYHLEKQAKKSPAVIRAINPEECAFEYDDGMLLFFVRKYKMRGSQMKSKYGEVPGKKCNEKMEYTIWDIWTAENHIIYAESYGTLMARPHNLYCLPIGIGFSGGSELFYKPEEQINSFLYAKMKSGLWDRETSLLTTINTNVKYRGLLGPLVYVEGDDEISIQHNAGVRIMRTKGKAQQIDDKVIDPALFQVKSMLDELSGQSTIYRQTLGENINAGTFSGLAMLSSSGKLPMVDPQRAMQQAFGEIFDYILYRIKDGGLDNPLIKPNEIPEQYELSVELKPKLPQDDMRNAQVAASLGPLVSDEWKHTNLLQIPDSAGMRKQVAKEMIYTGILQAMMQDQNFMQQMVMQVMGQPQPQPQTQPTQGQPMPEQPGIQVQGQPNMEQMPQGGPMIPEQERM